MAFSCQFVRRELDFVKSSPKEAHTGPVTYNAHSMPISEPPCLLPRVPMRDGVRLSVDLVRPDNVTEIPRVSESSESRHGIGGTGGVSRTVDLMRQ